MTNLSKLCAIGKVALVRDTKLFIKPILKSILIIMASHIGDHETCWPTIDALMRETEIGGRRHMIKYLNELESLNLIKKLPKGKRAHQYLLNFQLIAAIQDGMVPPWEPVPSGEPNQFPSDINRFPLSTNQFPRGNPKQKRNNNINKKEREDLFLTKEQKEKNKAAGQEHLSVILKNLGLKTKLNIQ